jgi:hypothetical protein
MAGDNQNSSPLQNAADGWNSSPSASSAQSKIDEAIAMAGMKAPAATSTPSPAESTPATRDTPWGGGTAATEQLGAHQLAERERLARPNILDVLKGFACGLIAALVCAFIWDKVAYYTSHEFGYAAIGVGFVVGTAVVLGASGKSGRSLQLVSALLALFGILLGQTLFLMDTIRDEFAKDPTLSKVALSSIDLFVLSAQNMGVYYKEGPLSALFLLLGLFYGFSIPGKAKAQPATEGESTPALANDAPAAAAPMSSAPAATSNATPASPFDAPPKS